MQTDCGEPVLLPFVNLVSFQSLDTSLVFLFLNQCICLMFHQKSTLSFSPHYIMAGLHNRTRHTILSECSFAIMISRVTSLDFCWGAWLENFFFVFISHKEYNDCIVLWWNKHNYKKCTGFTGIYATLPFCALRFGVIVLPLDRMLDY